MTARRPLSATAAQAVIDAAEIVKAPDWSDTRRWHVVSGGDVLVVIEPSYGGTSRSGRNGWRWSIAGRAVAGIRPEKTVQDAATVGLAAWKRWVTTKETR